MQDGGDALKILRILTLIIVLASLAWPGAAPARADEDSIARTASNSIAPFLVLGSASLLFDGHDKQREITRDAEALAATGLATELLKRTVREKRPNSDARTSFPSGHSSAAFAMATVLAEAHPRTKWLDYGIASTIAWSRVEVGAHRWRDVIAGAALGTLVAGRFTRHHFGLASDENSGGTGIGFSTKF
jgi:membrane-associated phospholipid phosphatase